MSAVEDKSLGESLAQTQRLAPATRAEKIFPAAHFPDKKQDFDNVNQLLEKSNDGLDGKLTQAGVNISSARASGASFDLQKHPLPATVQSRASWKRFRYQLFSTYRRLFTLIFTVNAVALVVFLAQLRHGSHSSVATPANSATAAAANFCIGVLMRNEHTVNCLFRIACSVPVSSPVWIRRYAAKVYCYGGVHSGCGVSGTMWYLTFCGLVFKQIDSTLRSGAGLDWEDRALAATTAVTVLLLVFILAFAHPHVRMKIHNHFETIHRYAGWTAIACLWLQTVSLVASNSKSSHRSFGLVLIQTPPFWFLVAITLCIIYPWTRLRWRAVRVEELSEHATRLHFDYLDKMETCQGVRLTHNPFKETHSFATIPNDNGNKGFSALISNAGDWTDDIIRSPRQHIFVKGAPTLGVMRVALLFRRILVIATGSGIGPCLSLLQTPAEDLPRRPEMRVIWSAQNPISTYRKNVVESVYRADRNAIIVDTKQTGRGNLLALSYGLFVESGAEAAVIISNPVVTRKVVHGLEACGVPAFGAIFDS
ncbi:hypothetical protein EV356DRAFT_525967 [Viridothelium virens]|uniref:Integral membrane protein TmpA n=1 Tax=Viridothelium virens TaxID=1048519 RepID=A0A6A6H0E7_VIRVR|nr:hypothetical protein EV356DRAFT_525967 [Viridothelium virens]